MFTYTRLQRYLSLIIPCLLAGLLAAPQPGQASSPFSAHSRQDDFAMLMTDVDFLDFVLPEGEFAAGSITLFNLADFPIDWTIFMETDPDDPEWLFVDPDGGEGLFDAETIDVWVDTGDMALGSYAANLVIVALDTGEELYVPVFLEVTAQESDVPDPSRSAPPVDQQSAEPEFVDPDGDAFSWDDESPDALSFSDGFSMAVDTGVMAFDVQPGDVSDAQTILLFNMQDEPLSWDIYALDEEGAPAEWLALITDTSTPLDTLETIDVLIDATELEEGIYFPTIVIENQESADRIEIPVIVQVGFAAESGASIYADSFLLSFEVAGDDPDTISGSFVINTDSPEPREFLLNVQDEWLHVEPDLGEVTLDTPQRVTVTVDPGALTDGFYLGEIELIDIDSFHVESVLVDVTIQGEVAPQTSLDALRFTATQGEISAEVQTVSVTGVGADSLEWFAYSDQDWLLLYYDAENADLLHVGVDSAYLPAIRHTGVVTIETNGGALEIPVTLDVQTTAQASIQEARPNLTITEFRLEPANAKAGDTVAFVATIQNTGNIAVTGQPFYVDLFFNPSREPRGGLDWHAVASTLNPKQGIQWRIDSLAAGASLTLRSNAAAGALAPLAESTTWDNVLPRGITETVLYVDSWQQQLAPSGRITESVETDNLSRIKVTSAPVLAPAPRQMELYGIDVKPAIQDLHNSIPLVAQKPTFVRAYVRSTTDATIPNVVAQLYGSRNGQPLPGAPLSPINDRGVIDVKPQPNRTIKNDAFLFQLPETWIGEGELTLKVVGQLDLFDCIKPGDASGSGANAKNCEAKVQFQAMPPLPLRFYHVQWQGRPGLPYVLVDDSQWQKHENELKAQFPIASVSKEPTVTLQVPFNPELPGRRDCTRTTPRPQADSCVLLRILREQLNSSHKQDKRYIYYYGMAAELSSTGWALIATGDTDYGSYVGIGADSDPTITAHELGHMHGVKHTRCSKQVVEDDYNPDFPNPQGAISPLGTPDNQLYGFHIFEQRIIPPSAGDIMSYCAQRWVSGFNYRILLNTILRRQVQSVTAPTGPAPQPTPSVGASASAQPLLLIQGDLNPDAISSVTVLNDPAFALPDDREPPGANDYTLRLENGAGGLLGNYRVTPVTATDNYQLFSLIAPYTPDIERVLLLHNGRVVDERRASTNPPSVRLTSPNGGEQFGRQLITVSWTASDADGDALTFNLDYSTDDGATWSLLSAGLTGSSAELDLRYIPGAAQARLRIRASDGFLSGADISDDSFAVPNSAPEPVITTPFGERYVAEQLVVLEGSAADLEDGELTGSRLVWRSTLDGELGVGGRLELNAGELQSGRHTITLTARDSAGERATAAIEIDIRPQTEPLPAILSLYPDAIYFVIEPWVSDTDGEFVWLENDGDTQLIWEAVTGAAWLTLDVNEGTAPSAIRIDVDAAGMEPGLYADIVTFTDQRSGMQQDLLVELEILNPDGTSANDLTAP